MIAGDAQAKTLTSGTVSAAKAVPQSCIASPLKAGNGVTTRTLTSPGTGFVTAKLRAARGDWDVAMFDRATHRRVAGSTYFGATEQAQGFALKGQRLVVQACRRSGSARTARLKVTAKSIDTTTKPETLSLVRVVTPNAARKEELTELGLDLTEHGGKGFVEVVLHGADDAKRLRDAKFAYVNEVPNLAKQDIRDRTAERKTTRATAAALPSGARTTYRRLDDYTQEMKTLASQNPDLVKPLTLPEKTLTGLPVQGIEITENATARDGKPVFLQMGVHHAREWPSGEHAMEWAYELIKGYKAGNPIVRRLMRSTRTIIVPVVNPEGFNTSREAGERAGFGGGRPGVNDTTETANLATPFEYQRKNCRVNDTNPAPAKDPARGDCTQAGRPNIGLSQFGVDPNRNYGGFWGGPGASASGEPLPGGDFAQDYRGDGPFSEVESRNVRALVSGRHVTTLITNHTFSNLVLRPPGIQSAGPPVDEPIYKALGDSMAANNGYSSQLSYQLYDTTGGTEDWTYYATGGLGFTFEIGLIGFHPQYSDVIAQYEGTTAAAANRGGNRAAYFKALENTADSSKHSTLAGKAPPGTILRLKKSFTTETSPVLDVNGVAGAIQTFPDTLNSTMETPSDGTFRWGINPSTRPIVAQAKGRPAAGPPSGPQALTSTTPGVPCGALAADNPACYEDIDFTVPAGGADNAAATVEINWATAASDYDVTVLDKATGRVVGTSAQGTTNSESTTFGEPGEKIAGRTYTVRVLNFAAAEPYSGRVSFTGPPAFKPARKESYTLTCESPGGKVGATRTIQIDRSQTENIDLSKVCGAVAPRQCVSTKGGIKSTGVGQARLGRTRTKQRKTLEGTLLSDRPGIDRYCMKKGGGSLRAGYPTSRLNSKLSKKTRKRIKAKAVLLLSTSKAFRLSKVKVGSSTKTVRKRLKGERRYKVGRNTWYVAKGKRARVLFRTRKNKVLEMGLADSRLTTSKTSTVRLLRAWDKRGKAKSKTVKRKR